jgi:hypothetical protein
MPAITVTKKKISIFPQISSNNLKKEEKRASVRVISSPIFLVPDQEEKIFLGGLKNVENGGGME